MAKLFHFLACNLCKKKDRLELPGQCIDPCHTYGILYQNNTLSVNLSMNPSEISIILIRYFSCKALHLIKQ